MTGRPRSSQGESEIQVSEFQKMIRGICSKCLGNLKVQHRSILLEQVQDSSFVSEYVKASKARSHLSIQGLKKDLPLPSHYLHRDHQRSIKRITVFITTGFYWDQILFPEMAKMRNQRQTMKVQMITLSTFTKLRQTQVLFTFQSSA